LNLCRAKRKGAWWDALHEGGGMLEHYTIFLSHSNLSQNSIYDLRHGYDIINATAFISYAWGGLADYGKSH